MTFLTLRGPGQTFYSYRYTDEDLGQLKRCFVLAKTITPHTFCSINVSMKDDANRFRKLFQ